jgi:hypothetical protein
MTMVIFRVYQECSIERGDKEMADGETRGQGDKVEIKLPMPNP